MRLPPFALIRPETLDQAIASLVELGDEAAVYMGGTELVPLMKLGFAAPAHLIDCKRIPHLANVGGDDLHLFIGPAVTHHRIERDERVLDLLPILATTTGMIGNPRVRAAGTLGGNLCFADPRSDPATLLTALSARVTVTGPTGSRELDVDQFIRGPLETDLGQDEMLVGVTIPVPPPGSVVIYKRFAVRERPTAAVALSVAGGRVRLVVGAIGGSAVRVEEAEALIADGTAHLSEIADVVSRAVEPYGDGQGSAEFKRHIAGVLARRAVANFQSM